MKKISVLHIPYSSRLIPADERVRLAISDKELDNELLRMTDAYTSELFPPTIGEAERIVFPVSRFVCDVERFPDDLTSRWLCAAWVQFIPQRAPEPA